MADTDLLGIVSLLLAAGGAAYLLRARFAAQARPVNEDGISGSSAMGSTPESDPGPSYPPNVRKKTPAPVPSAEIEPEESEKVKKPGLKVSPPEKSGGAPTAAALSPQAPEKAPLEQSNVAPDKAAEKPKPAADKAPPPEKTKAAPPEKPKAVPDKTKAPAKAPAKVETKDKPPSSAKVPKLPEPKVATAAKKQDDEAEKARRRAEAAKKRAAIEAEVPKLDVEEDEDVEPTIVGKVSRREIQPPVERIVVDEGGDKAAAKAASSLALYVLAETDPGKRRKQNEDSFLIMDKEGLFVVADGMGGHRGGQIASKLAVESIQKAYEAKRFAAEPHKDLPAEASDLARAIQMANAAILEEAGRRPELKGMGTTLVSARFTDDKQRLYIGHVGDSRCYRVRDGVMKQLTSDHTMADYGIAGPEGAHLSRALGVWPTVPIDVLMVIPQLGDLYLICSDGLTKMLPDGTIATQLLHEEDPKAAIARLIFFANAHGGKDNITLILVRVVPPGWKPPATPTRASKPEIA